MRLLVYKDSVSVGRGADRAVKVFSSALAARGHDARLVERDGLAAALAEPWDVVVATGSNEAVDLDRAGYFDRADRAPVVLQLHLAPRGFFKWKHPLRNRAIRRAFRRADAAQVLCSDYVEELRRIAPALPATVIGNYTEVSPAGAGGGGDGRMTVEESRIVLYPAAAVNKVKNQRLLVAAFARVAAAHPGWRVRLLGRANARYAASCRRLAARLGVADRVEFAGLADDMGAEYARAAFVAFPSTLEGFPLAVLEAARFALPVVAQASLPGVSDIVRDGETGFVARADAASYADALARLMSDAELRARLGANARRRCGELYSKERVLGAWESLFRKVLKKSEGE